MSYALRNTIILLVVLTVFVGAGWSYIYFYQQPRVEELEGQVTNTRKELNQKQQIADQYPILLNRYEKATDFFNNYNKALYASSNEDYVFGFMNSLNTSTSYVDFTFNFADSTKQDQYGVMNMQISGDGYYRNLVNFIRQIELNKPLNKISSITINPIDDPESFGKVNFNFTLQSFYDRVKLLGKPNMDISNNLMASVYNPFFPMIRTVKPNDDNLIDVEKSKLLAVSGNKVFLIDQDGKMQNLDIGDQIYLGSLSSVNVNGGSATFVLNRGGIIDQLTLQVNNDENKSKY